MRSNPADRDQRLLQAAQKGRIGDIRALMAEGAQAIHAALAKACEAGETLTAHYLLDAGADIHILDDLPLRAAAEKGREETVRLLLERGARVRALSDLALREAAANGHVSVMRLLLDAGASVHALNELPLRQAALRRQMEAVRLLVERGADLNALPDDLRERVRDLIVSDNSAAEF